MMNVTSVWSHPQPPDMEWSYRPSGKIGVTPFEEVTMAYHERPGCLGGLLRLFLLTWLFEYLQKRFGFGRGCSCTGIGCGFILLIVFLILACRILFTTDWGRLVWTTPIF